MGHARHKANPPSSTRQRERPAQSGSLPQKFQPFPYRFHDQMPTPAKTAVLRQWEEFQNGQPPWPNEHQFKECLRRIATSKAVALACSDLLKTASLGDQFVIDLVDRAIFLPSEYYLEPGRILKTDLKKIGKLIGFLS
ncbi:MAG TPA: hypothetical protein VGJ16_09180, partial [Pirellulales bacterium]